MARFTTKCPFCLRIGLEEYDWATTTRSVVSFEPLNPVVEGHRLFVPDAHVLDAADSIGWTGQTFEAAAKWVRTNRPGDAFNLITSAGRDASQTVMHLHVHYVPRMAEDGLRLPWTGQPVPAPHPTDRRTG